MQIKMIKYLLYKLIVLVSKIWSYENSQTLKLRMYKIYTWWVAQNMEHIADGILFIKPIRLIGGKFIIIGANTHINKFSVITAWSTERTNYGTPVLSIGDRCNIGEYNHITCSNRIKIGNDVLTGRWVTITDNSHGDNSFSDLNKSPIQRNIVSKGCVEIGDKVWIGDKATVLPGVKIGEGSVVAANSVVTKDVPPFSVVAGNPARLVKSYAKY